MVGNQCRLGAHLPTSGYSLGETRLHIQGLQTRTAGFKVESCSAYVFKVQRSRPSTQSVGERLRIVLFWGIHSRSRPSESQVRQCHGGISGMSATANPIR